jgi:tyrosyl-tRNA synthetase
VTFKGEIDLAQGANPKDIKLRLALEIVTLYHTEKDANLAKNSWVETFSKGGIPENVPEIVTTHDKEIVDLLIENGIVASKTEWRRLVDDKAVSDIEGEVVTDPKMLATNITLKIGKKRFVKIVVE